MTEPYREIIRRHSRPLAPLPTGQTPVLRALGPLDAVLFDVYGTLLVSASGDVGVSATGDRSETIVAALAAVGVPLGGPPADAWDVFHRQIEREHHAARQAGVDFPEVDIVQVWRSVLAEFAARGWLTGSDGVDLPALAVEFEVRVNPIWPMPNILPTLEGLRRAGKVLGVVSNAQFYTPEAFPALVGKTLADLGFEHDLQFYSYQHGQAKPGMALYRLAAASLQERGISTERALYVGNDLRNDITPAARLGFRTALFAGDARSLRRRESDPLCIGVVPDLVVTDLIDLLHCV
jgi:putative hydrolase of the HAD superfamily